MTANKVTIRTHTQIHKSATRRKLRLRTWLFSLERTLSQPKVIDCRPSATGDAVGRVAAPSVACLVSCGVPSPRPCGLLTNNRSNCRTGLPVCSRRRKGEKIVPSPQPLCRGVIATEGNQKKVPVNRGRRRALCVRRGVVVAPCGVVVFGVVVVVFFVCGGVLLCVLVFLVFFVRVGRAFSRCGFVVLVSLRRLLAVLVVRCVRGVLVARRRWCLVLRGRCPVGWLMSCCFRLPCCRGVALPGLGGGVPACLLVACFVVRVRCRFRLCCGVPCVLVACRLRAFSGWLRRGGGRIRGFWRRCVGVRVEFAVLFVLPVGFRRVFFYAARRVS